MATQRQKKRKAGSLERLEAQLASGVKPKRIDNPSRKKKGYSTSLTEKLPLTEQDKNKINFQITNLKKVLGQAA